MKGAPLVAFFLLAGCGGLIEGSETEDAPAGESPRMPGDPRAPGTASPPGTPGMTPGTPGTSGTPPAPAPPPGSPASAGPLPQLRRLTVDQYTATIVDLFGAGTRPPAAVEADDPVHGFAAIGASRAAISALGVEQFEAAALTLARDVTANEMRRQALLGCAPASPTDERCAREGLARLGRRIFRRPLADEELLRYTALVKRIGGERQDFWRGVEAALAAFLQSPSFLYIVEIGEPDPARPGRYRYGAYEMAARLSYFLWNTTPDAALLDAAAGGGLGTADGVRAQARRLLASSRSRAAIREIFQDLLRLPELPRQAKSSRVYPMFSTALRTSMMEETTRLVDDVVLAREADYRELFDARYTFVDAALAGFYGLGAPASGFVRVDFPPEHPRAGIVTHASLMARIAKADGTAPTRRGHFVREDLLCMDVPPPEAIANNLPTPRPGQTQRQFLEMVRRDPACGSCHGLMDPIGLALENFDGIGAFRTTDAGQTIDASGELDGTPFRNPRELAGVLRAHPALAPCLARTLFRVAAGRIEIAPEEAAVAALGQTFAGAQHRVRAYLLELVASDAFGLLPVPPPPVTPGGRPCPGGRPPCHERDPRRPRGSIAACSCAACRAASASPSPCRRSRRCWTRAAPRSPPGRRSRSASASSSGATACGSTAGSRRPPGPAGRSPTSSLRCAT
jgi:hypothetical protein